MNLYKIIHTFIRITHLLYAFVTLLSGLLILIDLMGFQSQIDIDVLIIPTLILSSLYILFTLLAFKKQCPLTILEEKVIKNYNEEFSFEGKGLTAYLAHKWRIPVRKKVASLITDSVYVLTFVLSLVALF